MELTGLQIFKYLPAAKKAKNTNCKNCGCPTCMAYALKLAKKQVSIESCPFIPEELKEKLTQASRIQQHEIKISDNLIAGGENVMFRHDKTFVNKTIIAIEVDTKDKKLRQKLEKIKNYSAERIGQTFKIDALYTDGEITEELQKFSTETQIPIIHNKQNYEIISGQNIQELEEQTTAKIKGGCNNIILQVEYSKNIIEQLTYIRRAAIIQRHAPLTYPVLVKIPNEFDIMQTCAAASRLICKYANIIVLDKVDNALLSTIMTLRQNIYTNPQKPLQVEAKIYEFNDPDKNAPILLTTNFALTYFAVASELEALPFGSYLVVTPSDGMSVLTAWSADKFTAELVAKAINEFGLAQKTNSRKIIIPGLLNHMKDELQEVLPDWDIVVGTIEACQIPDFLKQKL